MIRRLWCRIFGHKFEVTKYSPVSFTATCRRCGMTVDYVTADYEGQKS